MWSSGDTISSKVLAVSADVAASPSHGGQSGRGLVPLQEE